MKHTRLYSLLLLAFVITVAGCDNNGGDDNNDPSGLTLGSSSVEVTGDLSESADGTGIAAASNLSPGWGILLGAAEASASAFVIASDTGSRPSNGSYSITDASMNNLPAGQYRASLAVAGELFTSSSGTLTITESSSSSVKGTYDFDAIGLLDTDRMINVSGAFYATNQDDASGTVNQ